MFFVSYIIDLQIYENTGGLEAEKVAYYAEDDLCQKIHKINEKLGLLTTDAL